ncbi:MAG: hypothetical protein Q4C50_03225 [Eubacteriales bacterium]|nr:hypothetical protein [Eubacteriales bacterium]
MIDTYDLFISTLKKSEMTPDEADQIEEFLDREYPDIIISEEDLQRVFSKIKEIIKDENIEQNKKIWQQLSDISVAKLLPD